MLNSDLEWPDSQLAISKAASEMHQEATRHVLVTAALTSKKAQTSLAAQNIRIEKTEKKTKAVEQTCDALSETIENTQKHVARTDREIRDIKRDLALTEDRVAANDQASRRSDTRLDLIEGQLAQLLTKSKEVDALRTDVNNYRDEFRRFAAPFLPLQAAQARATEMQTTPSRTANSPSHPYAFQLANVPGQYAFQEQPRGAERVYSGFGNYQPAYEKPQLPQPMQPTQPNTTTQSMPKAKCGTRARTGSAATRPLPPAKKPGAKQQRATGNAARRDQEDESDMEMATAGPLTVAPAQGNVAPQSAASEYARLRAKLREADERNIQRAVDARFIWCFLDDIDDKVLSKDLQMFVAKHVNDKTLVHLGNRSRKCQPHRYISMPKLTWRRFSQEVRSFMRLNSHL
ncbi:hypothetical protein GE09DRAFT_1226718 [Coniochaeta sp. 2T2.1]|nr:hypothetical protein GE09DRAFT_1226718 [Coniochaeta sp. 2T2.1]